MAIVNNYDVTLDLLFPFFTDIEITPLAPTDRALLDVKRIHSLMKQEYSNLEISHR